MCCRLFDLFPFLTSSTTSAQSSTPTLLRSDPPRLRHHAPPIRTSTTTDPPPCEKEATGKVGKRVREGDDRKSWETRSRRRCDGRSDPPQIVHHVRRRCDGRSDPRQIVK
ncbi:hypothetical protein E3N88_38551 [Mikania micrantha]|uniref:Uncharacterized protein n=1 Tax=Mikania micrantha TaxID=192012 RepID=A0A5N6LUB4_9ASTR|nr:hypothetical protein E3N88_38551 [Mikania micrantha]